MTRLRIAFCVAVALVGAVAISIVAEARRKPYPNAVWDDPSFDEPLPLGRS